MITASEILQLIAELSPLIIQILISDGFGYDNLFFSNSMIRDSKSVESLQVFNFIIMLGLAVFIMGINSVISNLDILGSLIFVMAIIILMSAFPLAKETHILRKRAHRIIIALITVMIITIHDLIIFIQPVP